MCTCITLRGKGSCLGLAATLAGSHGEQIREEYTLKGFSAAVVQTKDAMRLSFSMGLSVFSFLIVGTSTGGNFSLTFRLTSANCLIFVDGDRK